jgi:toxin YoeB
MPAIERQSQHRRQLVHTCLRDPFAGIGKPEPLRDNLACSYHDR